MHQSGKPDCDVSEYYNITMAFMSAAIKRTIYFIVKNIKMAQFYKKKQKTKNNMSQSWDFWYVGMRSLVDPFPSKIIT